MFKFVSLDHLGLLCVQGPDAKQFLQGQVTCNLEEITPEQSRLAAHCNLKGRMQSLFRIFVLDQLNGQPQYFLSLPLAMVPLVQQHLKKYALFSQVQIEDYSTQLEKFGIYGELPTYSQLKIDGCLTQHTPQGSYSICRIPGLAPRYEIIGQPAAIESMVSEFKDFAEESSPSDWELWDIEAGIPTVFPSTSDLFLPHHVNLVALNGISFSKGCYLGQEIVARMHYRGNIKKHMYHAIAPKNSGAFAGDPINIQEASQSEAPGLVVRVAPGEKVDHVLVILDEQYASFANVILKGSKLTRLELPYSV